MLLKNQKIAITNKTINFNILNISIFKNLIKAKRKIGQLMLSYLHKKFQFDLIL